MSENAIVAMSDIEKAGNYIAKSGLFGVKRPEEAIALMLVAQAEGRNPFEAARDYHIIQGRPALKADAVLTRFQQAGGKVEWLEYTDSKVVGKFSHPQGGTITIDWTIEQAKRIGLTAKDNWKNYPRAMLRARCISEAVRTIYPGVASGIYTVEEVQDMTVEQPKDDDLDMVVTEPKIAEGQDTKIEKSVDELKAEAQELAATLNLTDEDKRTAWKQANHDWSAFVDMLKEKQAQP